MSIESKHELASQEMLYGWGAMLAIGRTALNLTLQDNFLSALASLTYLEPFTDTFAINEGNSQSIQIDGLVFGAAQVSFEHSVSTDQLITVRMPLLTGNYRYLLHLPDQPERLHRSLSIRESMNLTLEARGRLSVHTDLVARQRHVVLDLGQVTDCSSSLGETGYEQTQIGQRMQQWLKEQPEERRMLRLVTVDLRDYRPLTSRFMEVYTQPAPWSGEQGREGDGALLMFMQLGVDFARGNVPGADYPYLLPKDGSADTALVVQKDLQELTLGTPQQVLASLSQGARRELRLSETEGQLSFGALQAGPLTRQLAPATSSVIASGQRQFEMSGGSGDITWSARNLFRPMATGEMNAGLYRARQREDFVKQAQVVLVTGHAQDDPAHLNASALVVEYEQPLDVAPRTANWSLGDPAIQFKAVGGNAVTWSLEGEKLGTLTTAGNAATFTPDGPGEQTQLTALIQQRALIQRQRVRACYNDNGVEQSTEGCVIMVNLPASLDVEPAFVAKHDAFEPIQFRLPESWRDAARTRGCVLPDTVQQDDIVWGVVGEGQISASGLYTPAESSVFSSSVVTVVVLDMVFGYAIIEHGQYTGSRSAAVSSWNDLDHFYVKAKTAPQCFANGMQQIQVEVDILTKDPGDGSHGPISDDELQGLRFYIKSGSELPVVAVGLEPPLPGEPGTWAMNRQHNPLLEMQPAQGNRAAAPAALAGQTIVNFWLQTTSTMPVEVYAMFKQSGLGGQWFNSETVSQQNGKLAVCGIMVPTYDLSRDYPWDDQPKRVHHVGPVVATPAGDDTFSYMTLTIDYWKLTHVISEGRRIPFVAIDVKTDDNRSTMRWASNDHKADECSYSGFMFGTADDQMIYDGALVRMAGERLHPLQALYPERRPANGELLLSLNRVVEFLLRYEQANIPIDQDKARRKHLTQPFRFRLLDQQGNRHDLQVSFAGALPEGRNNFFLGKPADVK